MGQHHSDEMVWKNHLNLQFLAQLVFGLIIRGEIYAIISFNKVQDKMRIKFAINWQKF